MGASLAEIRIAIFGASNLEILLHGIIDVLRLALPERPIRVFAAKGPGRGYCCEGGFLNRRYPLHANTTLVEDFLNKDLKDGSFVQAYVMDLGNDLPYGASASETSKAVGELIRPIVDGGIPITIAAPPVQPILRLRRMKFEILRRILFPRRNLDLGTIQTAVVDLCELVQEFESPLVKIDHWLASTVGADAIHVAWSNLGQAAARIGEALLGNIEGAHPAAELPVSRILAEWWKGRSHRPKTMRIGSAIKSVETHRYSLAGNVELMLY